MSNPLNDAGIFLINTVFDLYLFVLMLRLILVKLRADYFNPISQTVIKLTQAIINPLKKILPNAFNIEFSTLLFMFALEIIKFILLNLIYAGIAHPLGIVILSIADILHFLFNSFFYSILALTLLSWIKPGYSPLNRVLTLIASPILKPLQKIIPLVGGIDITPLPALIGLHLLTLLIVNPLFILGSNLTLH